jgi:hypothetical protein
VPGFFFREATMPLFTIETSYRLPVYRRRTYEADTIEQACHLAIEDGDWTGETPDPKSACETYVSGIWQGADAAHRGDALVVPSQFREAVQRRADHLETLLGLLKLLGHVDDLAAPDLPFWLPRAQAAIAKAEAILAGAPNPE